MRPHPPLDCPHQPISRPKPQATLLSDRPCPTAPRPTPPLRRSLIAHALALASPPHLRSYVKTPPIECVCFSWGVCEDRQLGIDTDQNVAVPTVAESLLGLQFSGRGFGRIPIVAGSRNTLAIDADGQVGMSHGPEAPGNKLWV